MFDNFIFVLSVLSVFLVLAELVLSSCDSVASRRASIVGCWLQLLIDSFVLLFTLNNGLDTMAAVNVALTSLALVMTTANLDSKMRNSEIVATPDHRSNREG